MIKALRNIVGILLASLGTAGVAFVFLASSPFSTFAQGGKVKLPRDRATPNLITPAGELHTEKVETSGGPKKEYRAPQTKGNAAIEIVPEKIKTLESSGKTGGSPTPAVHDSSAVKKDNPGAAKTAKTYEVGIIPGANGCPSGSELITIYMDDEDHNNANSSSGWIGATYQGGNTGFKFCRVDGTQFPLVNNAVYAVLMLGTNCPNSAVISRKFDNEHHKNRNDCSNPNGIYPNYSNKGQANTQLVFCLFDGKSGSNGITSFPNLGVEYGVFAAPDFPGILDSGFIHIDDEDEDNKNSYGSNYYLFQAEASKIISGNLNTDIHFVKVNSGAPVYGSLHSVTLNTTTVEGGSPCSDIVITVNLDGPARPGGQPVHLSSSNQQKAGIYEPKFFTIPEGQTSESASCFMGTEKVTIDKTVVITVTVNGKPGQVNLDVVRKKK